MTLLKRQNLKKKKKQKIKVTIMNKRINLYDTSFGNYDFQSALQDAELSELMPVGKELL